MRKNYELNWLDHTGKVCRLMVPIPLAWGFALAVTDKYGGCIIHGIAGMATFGNGGVEVFWRGPDGKFGPPERLPQGTVAAV